MYYPMGWPRLLKAPVPLSSSTSTQIVQCVCNRDRILVAVVTHDALQIWYVKPCVPIISHRRSPSSQADLGSNTMAIWRPDSSMIAVATSKGHLIIYHIVVPTDVRTLYEQIDDARFRRESDELFIKETIPPLIFALAFEVEVADGILDGVAFRDELMLCTGSFYIRRFAWDGQELRDYTLDLRRIPFCFDQQQVLKAVPLQSSFNVVKIAYSPLLGGFAIVLSDGRAALLVASSPNFDPNAVTGVWAPGLDDATCVALNHKYKLLAFGRKNSQGVVYFVDELSGALTLSHSLVLRTRDFPGDPGSVRCMRWTPDSTALALSWSRGGFSLWSTFGAMIVCSLSWDYGLQVSDPVAQNPLCLQCIDWSAEGYQLWMVNAIDRERSNEDVVAMRSPGGDVTDGSSTERAEFRLKMANALLVLNFVKSPISVNPGMSKHEKIYLQGEDKLYLNLGENTIIENNQSYSLENEECASENEEKVFRTPSKSQALSTTSRKWTTISIPHTYISNSWPIRYTALDSSCQWLSVAGRTGLAYYSMNSRRWRLFGNESQEKDFIVTGGLLWWREYVVIGCYNLNALQDEVRLYSRNEKLDNSHAKIVRVETQVLLINILHDQLVVYCADNIIDLYKLAFDKTSAAGAKSVSCTKTLSLNANSIPGLSFHPACVSLVALTKLRTETLRHHSSSNARESQSPPLSSTLNNDVTTIILNVCGRVIMIQINEETNSQIALPTVLATCCESIWFPRHTSLDKPHLTASLWLYCGIHGMRVWLPVFPRQGETSHSFMSKRIMLHFPMHKLYPLAILFEDAILLGAETDTLMLKCNDIATTDMPYAILERNSLLFLHPILRQLIRRNLGYHAYSIARTCVSLAYFQHSLELLLHEVLEEEATSTEPIPDALLPSVVEFIQEFTVYHKTIGRCARKTEVALWPHLFAVVGSPRTLFIEALTMNDLDTASTYLLILENLEPSNVAQNHATLLLDASLEQKRWKLAKELIRFLRTIDPGEFDSEVGRTFFSKTTPHSPPISTSAPEEDISMLLGTLQVPRGRAPSVSHSSKVSPLGANKEPLNRTNSESGSKKPTNATANRHRLLSSSSTNDEATSTSAKDVLFIDMLLQRHARKLLSQHRLKDLGCFAGHLDFYLVSWLQKEQRRAARINDVVRAFKAVHTDFDWPWPLKNKLEVERSDSGYFNSNDKIDYETNSSSGVASNEDNNIGNSSGGSALNERAIRAMLSVKEDYSDVNDDVSSVTSTNALEDDLLAAGSPRPRRPSAASINTEQLAILGLQEATVKGSTRSETQLRYLLQMFLEANCLEWSLVLSLVLKDALALIRIVNSARTHGAESPSDNNLVFTLLNHLKAIQQWASHECVGYLPFFRAIDPQMSSLQQYLREHPTPSSSSAQSSSSVQSSSSSSGTSSMAPSKLRRSSTTLSTRKLLPSDLRSTEVISQQRSKDDALLPRRNIMPSTSNSIVAAPSGPHVHREDEEGDAANNDDDSACVLM